MAVSTIGSPDAGYQNRDDRFDPSAPELHHELDRMTTPEGWSVDNVALAYEEVDPESGVPVRHMHVADYHFERMRRISPELYELSIARQQQVRQEMDALEAMLRDDPSDEATAAAKAVIYGDSPAMAAWGELMPSAAALSPLYQPHIPLTPNGVKLDKLATERFGLSLDAVAMRSRATLLQAILVDFAVRASDTGEVNLRELSIACGAAIPVFMAMREIKALLPDMNIVIDATDWDANALKDAKSSAGSYGIREEELRINRMNIVKSVMYSDELEKQLAERPNVVDLIGIFEYFDKERAALLLKKAFALLAENGLLVFGNMLNTHPQLQVNQRAVGWPKIYPRSIAEIKVIIELAGLDIDDAAFFVPTDGVYAVVSIRKKAKQQVESQNDGDGAQVIQFPANNDQPGRHRRDLQPAA